MKPRNWTTASKCSARHLQEVLEGVEKRGRVKNGMQTNVDVFNDIVAMASLKSWQNNRSAASLHRSQKPTLPGVWVH